MRKQPYLPAGENDRVTWLNNFALKLADYKVLFGISDALLLYFQEAALMWAYIINLIEQNRTDMLEFTSYKDALSDGPSDTDMSNFPTFSTPPPTPNLVDADIFGRAADLATTIKKQKGKYTDAIGKDLGIVGAEVIFDPDTYKTTLKLKTFDTFVQVKFVKKGVTSINLYMRTSAAHDWKLVAERVATSPYKDTTPLAVPGTPEKREYMAKGVIDNDEIGLPSDIVEIVYGGGEVS